MKLSVLDQAPISRGSNPVDALQHSIELAKVTEKLGYTRYWVAEHHSTNGLASSSPEILITRIASETSRIRVGSGGVLLPQYAPYKVAENFKMLEALFPNRIDLGLGRSPGGSQQTRLALTDGVKKNLNAFPRQLQELQGFLYNALPKDHPYRTVKATPRVDTYPEVWVLGLSERGATNAAKLGVGFCYGHFINPVNGELAIRTYREKFEPSISLQKPHVLACIFVVCAETEEKAEELALSQDKWLLSVEKGGDTKVPSLQEVKNKTYSDEERRIITKNRKRTIIGTPIKVKEALENYSELYGIDEFMIITNIYEFDAKVRSYELLANTFGLAKS
ncbi:LLM class flavin-dependent oxidoreductase [Aquibacillus sediminis]|uniref:LLM class flavin-dependent oxidoreductase n=1 Tax=Aquibacillus sediminis TaxID=2574734 RepID=UPI001109EFAF|nr:LLM class flavin-dependent oxidoreductase [Aquibacillus sediminis]